MQNDRYIAAADLGSSKLALSVARVEGDDVQIIYYKETPSDGIRYSCVFNPKRAALPLKAAIKDAEEELGIKILQIVVGLPRYELRQDVANAKIQRSDPGSCITMEEINAIKNQAVDDYSLYDESNEEIYGAIAQSFSADDLVRASEEDVVGTSSDELEGHFKIYIGARKAIGNIDRMLNDAGIAPALKLFVPSTVAKAVLSDGDKDNGVALVELGAGVSSLTIYTGKILRHYSSIPFGGKSITSDIKYECGFTDSLAENIKLAFGSCIPDKLLTLSEKVIQINDDEDGSYQHLPVRYLSEIIGCRTREIISAILYQIQESGYADKLRNGIVLTGGGANLVNIANLFKEMSGYNVRIGYPRSRNIITEGCNGIGETSAVASIGMILEAARYPHLNCIEENPEAAVNTRAEKPADTAAAETGAPAAAAPAATPADTVANVTGELFDVQPGEVIVPHKKDKGEKKQRKSLFNWTKVGQKLENTLSGIEKTFDGTVGDLFDTME